MKKITRILLIASGLLLSASFLMADTNTFTETFTSTTYKATNTTANWNTAAGDLRLNTTTTSSTQTNSSVAKDSSGNYIVVWLDNRNGGWNIYGAKYNSAGTKVWGDKRLTASNLGTAPSGWTQYPKIAGDKAGNFYVLYCQTIGTLYVHKFNSSGTSVWRKVADSATHRSEWTGYGLALDSSNNIYVAYQQYGPSGAYAYASKFNSSGTKLWGDKSANSSGSAYDVTVSVYGSYLYVAHRSSSNGALDYCRLNTSTGAKIGSDINVGSGSKLRIAVATNGYLCAVYVSNYSVYYARYNTSGTRVSGPKMISTTGAMYVDRYDPEISIDTSNNKYIVFMDRSALTGGYDRRVMGQKLNSSDTVLWASGGVQLCQVDFLDQLLPQVTFDGTGGLFSVWLDPRFNSTQNVFGNRISSSGARVWGTDKRIAATTGTKYVNGIGQSIAVDNVTGNITAATLTYNGNINGQSVTFQLSNNGGGNWYNVTPASKYIFSTTGSDLRFRILLTTLNGSATPYIYDLTISYDYASTTGGTGMFPYRMYWDTSWLNGLSGWMGSNNGSSLTCNPAYTGTYYSGSNCTMFTYNKSESWAGIYSLYNGWNGPGVNLNGNKRLTFMAKSNVNGVVVTFGLGQAIDTAKKEAAFALTTTWQRITIDLTGLDLSRINGVWYFFIEASRNTAIASPITFYVDEACYDEMTPTAGSSLAPADPSFAAGECYVYPNPAKKGKNPIIHVETGIADKVEINIYDVSGALVADTEINDAPAVSADNKYAYEYEWDVSGKASGAYIAQIVATKGSDKLKITKKFAVVK
ncbi:MAG: T9SS type A sorting domain-containing protein [bacterium]|nr:T9SS type A sorting domain-containing protein [bacterium]MDD5354107.1 T9SS type A sorting domain-containing protein [bacterium]